VQTTDSITRREAFIIAVISAKEAAAKWGVNIRIVQRYCLDGRIPGAQKYGNNWLIPAAAEKPGDGRRVAPQPPPALAAQLSALITAATRPLPADHPEGILATIREPRLQRQIEAELAYLRGDFKQTMGCFTAAGRDEAAKIYVAPMAIAAAISLGDYRFYSTIDGYLKGVIAAHPGTVMATYAELALATAEVLGTSKDGRAYGLLKPLVADKKLDLQNVVLTSYMRDVEKSHPQYFADLKKVN